MKIRNFGFALVFSSVVILPWFMIDASTYPKYTAFVFCAALIMLKIDARSFSALWKSRDWVLIFSVIFFALSLLVMPFHLDSLAVFLFGSSGRLFGIALIASGFILGLWIYINFSRNLEMATVNSLQISVTLVCLYHFLQLFDLDPIEWEAWYGKPISFLGNPNFVSSFTGLGITALCFEFIYARFGDERLNSKTSNISSETNIGRIKFQITRIIFLLLLYIFTLVTNGSFQGFLVAAIGISSFVVLHFFRSYRSLMVFLGLVITLTATSLVLLRDEIIRNPSVSTRLFFWDTGLSAFFSSPVIGSGPEALSRDFSRFASVSLIDDLGISNDVKSDSSHNYFIDLLFSYGIFITVTVLGIFLFAVLLGFRDLRMQTLSAKFWLALLIAFLVQAMISPPQVSLVMWGFVILFSALAAQLESRRESKHRIPNLILGSHDKKTNAQKKGIASQRKSQLVKKVLFIPFLVTAILPTYSDIRFRESLYTQDLGTIEVAATLFPTNVDRIYYAARIMCSNSDFKRTERLINEGLSISPREIRLLLLKLRIPLMEEERKIVISKILEVDPKNQSYKREWSNEEKLSC